MSAKKQNHRDIPYNDNTSVHITWTEGGDIIHLRGYAISTKNGIKREYAKDHKITVKNITELPSKQQHLYQRVGNEIDQHERPLTVKQNSLNNETKSPYELALEEVEKLGFVSDNWGPSYTKNRLVYFRRNILPILEKYDVCDWTIDDTNSLQAEIVELIMRQKRSSQHEHTANRTAKKSLAAASLIYRAMKSIDSSLPDIDLHPRYIGNSILNEQIKALPISVKKRLISSIEALVYEDPRLAFAAVFMVACGLRTAEAAGVWLDCIYKIDEDLASVSVEYQIKKGERIKILKNQTAYRLVPINTWGRAMIERCLNHLPNDPNYKDKFLCSPQVLSKKLKKTLLDAGLSKDYVSTAEYIMEEKPDIDGFGQPVRDVSAYIIRRDWSSTARTWCGYSSLELDYSLGHRVKLPKKIREDLRQADAQKKLAIKLERYVLNPQFSKHPYYNPISIKHSIDMELTPFNAIRIKNSANEPVEVKLDLEANLNADCITIICPDGSIVQHKERFIPVERRYNKEPLIGNFYYEEDSITNEE